MPCKIVNYIFMIRLTIWHDLFEGSVQHAKFYKTVTKKDKGIIYFFEVDDSPEHCRLRCYKTSPIRSASLLKVASCNNEIALRRTRTLNCQEYKWCSVWWCGNGIWYRTPVSLWCRLVCVMFIACITCAFLFGVLGIFMKMIGGPICRLSESKKHFSFVSQENKYSKYVF